MGDLIQFRDYQSKAAIERAHQVLEDHHREQQAAEYRAAAIALNGETITNVQPFYDPNPKETA